MNEHRRRRAQAVAPSLRRPRLGCSAALLAAASALLAACAPLPAPRRFAGSLDEPLRPTSGRIAVIADLQRTSALEFWRESNDPERAALVRALAAARPDAVFVVGDLVFDGGSARHWADLDALMAPVRDAGIPVFAAFGNHEYWCGGGGERHLFARFPHLGGRRWYEVAHGSLRFVVLDSNIDELTPAAWDAQLRWYEGALRRLDADPSARAVLVLAHHPPYTNSTVTGDEPHVQRHIVPPLLRSRKALALISGHVHNHERFQRGGKLFIVAGGGGGPRAALAQGAARRHPDDLARGAALRPFHFLLISPAPEGLAVEVRGLPKGGSEAAALDHFTIPWPAP
ncbi:metallophosphoesterase family protein [Sorangium sp. So ce406]|uniref:metallophosphoesterase family protein n=1 Tax=Sorangium sp. So ce406 TaxID=3133311 RepID=UPI003F5C24D4